MACAFVVFVSVVTGFVDLAFTSDVSNATNNVDNSVLLASGSFTVKVVSHVCPNPHCELERESIRLFIPRHAGQYSQHNLGCEVGQNSYSFGYDPHVAVVGFGVQENAWYWRGPAATRYHQNPDNAGMQVIMKSGCSFELKSSVHDRGDPPDARRLLDVKANLQGGLCVVTLRRKPNPSLCVSGRGAKTCCGPCKYQPQLRLGQLGASLGFNSTAQLSALPPCCTKTRDGGTHTC